MRIEFSDECEIATYLTPMEGYTVRIEVHEPSWLHRLMCTNAQDYKIKSIDEAGLVVWMYDEGLGTIEE